MGQGLGEGYAPPRAPTLLIPEAPSLSPSDTEVDDFLQVPNARERFSVSGKGLAVVVIDSGINTSHIMFAGRLIEGRNFSDDGGPNEMRDTGRNQNTGLIEPNGHGSNVAGIIAGTKLPAFEQMPIGIAHDAKIIPLKVFPGGSFAKINESLQWILDNRDRILEEHGVLISVVNMSLGIPGDNRVDDSGSLPQSIIDQRDLIRQLREKHVAVVISSGNSYASAMPSSEGMSIPGIFKETVSVAAVYDTNFPAGVPPLPRTYVDGGTVKQAVAGRLTVFSQRLSETTGGVYRTDICGPGFFVTSAGPAVGSDPNRSRTTQDGTSQAAPTVSGLILLGQQLWRDKMLAADPSSFSDDKLPTVDEIESSLRDGGITVNDLEDAIGIAMDNVTSSGQAFVRADATGFLSQIDSLTPSTTPTAPRTLQALQAELFGKSPEDQKRIIGEFKKGEGIFETFNKR